jgi:transposase
VKAYVKRNKNDAADAEAICEAVRRPTMRFVGVKSAEQQGRLMQHRARDLLLRQRTQVIYALRAHMAELGIVAAQGREGLKALLAIIADDGDERLPTDARASLIVLAAQLQALQTLIGSIEKWIIAQHRASEESKRVATIPGIGVLGQALSLPLSRTRAHSGRGAILRPGSGWYLGKIQPGANKSLGRFPSRATATCGALLVVGAHAVLRRAKQSPQNYPWLAQLLARRPFKVVAIALANKMRASPGRCWPGEAPIGRHDSRRREKRPTDGRMRLRPCVS